MMIRLTVVARFPKSTHEIFVVYLESLECLKLILMLYLEAFVISLENLELLLPVHQTVSKSNAQVFVEGLVTGN